MYEPIFPGMDPFIEDQRWMEFHTKVIDRIHDELSRLLVPEYAVIAEHHLQVMRPDISIIRGKAGTEPLERPSVVAAEATRIITPTLFEIDDQSRIEIRDSEGRLVTVIEVLSPSNKETHRSSYLSKRDALLDSTTHLIEIDFLRGGKRIEADFLPEGYVILVARAQPGKPHRGEVYEFGLRDPLPIIPVPLAGDDPDVPLNLPALFRDLYIAARYRLQLDYSRPPAVPLTPEDQAWVDGLLKAAGVV